MRETGAKIGSGFRTLFWGPLVLAHFPQAPKTGSHFLARVLGGGVPPRPSLWSSLLEPSNLDADQKSSARCSQITYMIICGIQSYSLNCSQKEQGGSSSLHVRMYALVLAPCSNCGGPLASTFSTPGSFEPASKTVGHEWPISGIPGHGILGTEFSKFVFPGFQSVLASVFVDSNCSLI